MPGSMRVVESILLMPKEGEEEEMVKKAFKKSSVCLCLSLLLVFSSQIVLSQEYPTKPVTLVIPSGAGSATDIFMRSVTSVAADYLGQPIINKLVPGGGGAIGCDSAAKAAPDGYTLLAGSSPWSTGLPAIEGRSKGPNDLAVVCRLNYSIGFMAARPDAPFKTYKQMMEWIKANPGKLVVGTPGPWTPPDMVWKHLMKQSGTSFKIVQFQGGGEAMIALLGGHVDAGPVHPLMAMPYKDTGKLVFLFFFDEKRHPDFPNVPTSLEEGMDPKVNMLACSWRGILAPKGTPRPIIDKLAMAFKKMTEDKSAQTMMQKSGDKVNYLGPDEFVQAWRAEFETYKELGGIYKK
jgi:tripartite-type tricarboxylate transporter receptor subunit TctC